uniref:N-alpha-acetyltransferase 35, NatC auxiliary subunit n=1 Tax=Anthurium amnicola TaxID=1678845 RepID=A0A1D1ZAE2_9ARAE
MEGEVAGGGGPLPQMIPSGEQTVWADASHLIQAACNELKDGDLIRGENFSLFAAMSALEIMDPKMDSGMEKCGYHSLEEAIESGAAPVPLSSDRTLDVQCCIDVMDHLLACEATWHKGHSLAQTVFSCIYLLRIERTSSHAILHSYCRIIQATCNLVVSSVSDARTHEEEDHFTMSYGLPLKGEGDEKWLSILNSVEETLCRQLRACKAPGSKKKLSEDIESLQPIVDLEEGYCKAILCRLRFRKHFYHVLMCMKKPQGRGLELARKHIVSCLSELACIYKSLEFLRSNAHGIHQDDIKCATTASGCHPIGFAPGLNNRLLAPAPPRAIKLLTLKEAINYFEKLLHDLDIICLFPLDPSLEGVMRFVVQFQKSQPDLVARAHLQLLLIQDGKLYGRDPFYDVIIKALPMPEAIRNQEFQKQFQKNELVVQLGQLVVNLLKVLCTNTAWQRRKLGKILQDWSVVSIQLELAFRTESGETFNFSVDENLLAKVSKHLLVWVEEQTYWIASRFLMLGFELDLYSPGEYCMVYWYMYVVFIKLLEKMQLRLECNSENLRKKGKKKRELSKDVVRDLSPAILLLQCYICLSEGLAMLLAALSNVRSSFQIPSIFNSEQEHFIQHFELLQKARVPEGVSYNLFKESVVHANISSIARYHYFMDAQKIAVTLRGSFSGEPDKLAELRQIEQVAEHNRIALNVINQVGASEPSLRVTFEFSHHPCFAVAVVKRS